MLALGTTSSTRGTTDWVTNLVTVAVLLFFGGRLLRGLWFARRGPGRELVRAVLRRVRWRHIWPVPLLLGVVVAAATGLMQIPGLDWGWWSAVGGQGNPVFGSSDATAGSVFEWLIPLVFMALLLPALPLFAHAEERIFRTGAERWSTWRRIIKVIQFGLVHALIGIPIGAALALSIGGAYFMWVYLREYRISGSAHQATLESTTAHTAYNGVIITVVIISFVALAFGL